MSELSEFTDFAPTPRRGLTSIEAAEFLRPCFPDVRHWLHWEPGFTLGYRGLSRLPVAVQDSGAVGEWRWTRLAIPYPTVGYHEQNRHFVEPFLKWTGAIRVVEHASAESFIVFSYLSSTGTIGEGYMSSAHDVAALSRFAEAALKQFGAGGDKIRIRTVKGEDIQLDPAGDERLCLPPTVRQDIEAQVESFFRHPEVYTKYGIPRRRGFLFVGPPGNGKTMMMRHLVRRCWETVRAEATLLVPHKRVDEDVVEHAFLAACTNGPGILILDDMDTLLKECDLTRAGFLALLDGMRPKESVLILASTNNPGDIDPALIHRPSRFDRVWHFDMPTVELRRQYLELALAPASAELVAEVARGTEGWSFAYLNELRTTAIVLAIGGGRESPSEDDVMGALRLLAEQFRAGKHHHVRPEHGTVGFRAA